MDSYLQETDDGMRILRDSQLSNEADRNESGYKLATSLFSDAVTCLIGSPNGRRKV